MCLCTVQLPPIDDDEFARGRKEGGENKNISGGEKFLNLRQSQL